MIKNIVFDMGGVLIEFDPEKTLHQLFPPKTADVLLENVFLSGLWRERDRGNLTSRDIMDRIGYLIPQEDYELADKVVFNLFPYMKIYDDIPLLIENLKGKGYGIYLLSNSSYDFYENKHNVPVLDEFDGLFISADYHLLKPDKEIYEKFFEVEGIKAEECFFIDDMPENIEGARKCGMRGFVYSHGHIDKLLDAMRKEGIDI